MYTTTSAGSGLQKNPKWTLVEKCPYLGFFWFVYSHIQTEYGEIRSIFPYSVRFSHSGNETRICTQTCPGIWILEFFPQFRAKAGFLCVKKLPS